MEDDEYENLPTERMSVHLIAGGMAGMMEHCVMYPVDCVKTRMQSLKPNPNASYKNIVHAMKCIIKNEGIFAPLRGINIVAIGSGPAHALYFSSYEYVKKRLNGNSQKYNALSYGIAGTFATVFHDGAMNPIEVIKQRLQMYNSPYKGAIDCATKIMKTEGLKAFYRSYTTQLSMNIPFQTLHFMVYEFAREKLNPSHTYDPKTHVIAGGTAGALAAAITTPLDVAKTLLNTQESNVVALVGKPQGQVLYVSGMFNAFRTIYRMRGLTGYFQGLQARVVYQMPSCAICWSVYEFFKYFLHLNHSADGEFHEISATQGEM